MQYSDEQLEVISAISHGSGNLVVDARAGAAKTTTAVAGVNASPPQDILCCAFNKRIADELQTKMPPYATCKTLNALGHGAWIRRVAAGARIKLDKRKNYRIANDLDPDRSFPDLPQAMSLVKSFGLVPKGNLGDGKGLLPDEPSVWLETFDAFDLDLGYAADPVGLCREATLRGIARGWKGDIDFDDQLYLSAIFKAPFQPYDMVVIDEAQDISPIQRQMLHLMLKSGGRLVAIGDEHQAIYGFRGADRDSIRNIAQEWECNWLKLTTSFRCPQSVVREAQRYVPDIRPWDQSPEGSVRKLSEFDESAFLPGDVILCRNNAPIISLCFKLISRGVGASVIGREIGTGLTKLIKQMKSQNLKELNIRLEDYRGEQLSKLRSAGRYSRASAIEDRVNALQSLISLLGETATVNQLLTLIDRMFSERQPIELCTIHKAKGLEWRRVNFLDRFLVPSKWAKGQALVQENNLAYVAVTRSQQELIYVDSTDMK